MTTPPIGAVTRARASRASRSAAFSSEASASFSVASAPGASPRDLRRRASRRSRFAVSRRTRARARSSGASIRATGSPAATFVPSFTSISATTPSRGERTSA